MYGQSKSWRVDVPTPADLERLHAEQMLLWPLAAANYAGLSQVMLRRAGDWEVQFNPSRAVSAKADVRDGCAGGRPCFLCRANRPSEQSAIEWRDYEILVNPFPIFSRHYTVAACSHRPQSLAGRVGDMAALSQSLPGYVVFYNGARCGASAPDHMHMQIALWSDAERLLGTACGSRRVLIFDNAADAARMLDINDDVNVLATGARIYVIPRRAHRPSDYSMTLISPGAVDVAGRFITVLREVYESLTAGDIERVLGEVCDVSSGSN